MESKRRRSTGRRTIDVTRLRALSFCEPRRPVRHFRQTGFAAGQTGSLPITDAAVATPKALATETVKTTGILHFTIGVRDQVAASKFYAEVLGCKIMRVGERYAFMDCNGSYFVLAKMPNHVNPNKP